LVLSFAVQAIGSTAVKLARSTDIEVALKSPLNKEHVEQQSEGPADCHIKKLKTSTKKILIGPELERFGCA
jgi:hypothetical protein